ncbi:FG-GAP repeat protein [Pseudofulvimonas gallinarii]|nr:FG-GAP repeat protein [Pseudofulvimonas gallinarii]
MTRRPCPPHHLFPLLASMVSLAMAAVTADAGTPPEHGLVRIAVLTGNYHGLPEQDSGDGPEFGASIAIDGDWMAVGAPGTVVGNPPGEKLGAVFLFKRNGQQWEYRHRVTGFPWGPAPRCGHSVALKLPRVALGCPEATQPAVPGSKAGAFVNASLHEDNWNPAWGVISNDVGAECGRAIALTPYVLDAPHHTLVGCPGDDQGRGSIWRFTNGNQNGKLTAADGQPGDRFGEALSLYRLVFAGTWQTLAVGAPGRSLGPAAQSGAVYVFQGADFIPTSTLTYPNGHLYPHTRFGTAVAANFSNILVGAPGGTGSGSACQTVPRCGNIHRYTQPEGIWLRQDGGEAVNAGGEPPGGQAGMEFGSVLALGSGNWLAASAPLADRSTATLPPAIAADVGMVELRRADDGSYGAGTGETRGELRPGTILPGASGGRFGTGLAFGADHLAIGYPRQRTLMGQRRGQVWVYVSDRIFVDGFEP